MIFFFIFAIITLAVNAGLWWYYHRQSIRQAKDYLVRLNNTNTCMAELLRQCEYYRKANAELLRRCEHYRAAAVTEALAAKMRTQPVIKVYPIQRRNMTWIIENHLN